MSSFRPVPIEECMDTPPPTQPAAVTEDEYDEVLSPKRAGEASASSNDEVQQAIARKRLIGLSLVALSSFLFSVMGLIVHVLGSRFGAMEIAFFRFFVQSVACCTHVVINRVNVWPPGTRVRTLLLSRGLCSSFANIAYFFALSHMSLSDATVLGQTSPIFTAILAALLLKEGWTLVDAVGTLVCFGGILLVARPTFMFGGASATSPSPINVLVALTGAILSAGGFIFMRALGNASVDPIVTVFWFGILGIISSVPMSVAFEHPVFSVSLRDAGLIAVLGVLAYAGQLLLAKGLAKEKAGPAVMMRYLDIVFAFVWQLTLLHSENVAALSFVGAALIISCAGVNPAKLWYQSRVRAPPVVTVSSPALEERSSLVLHPMEVDASDVQLESRT